MNHSLSNIFFLYFQTQTVNSTCSLSTCINTTAIKTTVISKFLLTRLNCTWSDPAAFSPFQASADFRPRAHQSLAELRYIYNCIVRLTENLYIIYIYTLSTPVLIKYSKRWFTACIRLTKKMTQSFQAAYLRFLRKSLLSNCLEGEPPWLLSTMN